MNRTERGVKELIEAYDEYIALLGKSEGELLKIAHIHGGGCSPELVRRGEELRAKIADLKQKIG